jgi:transposase
MEYIALDVHKKYTWARVENRQGERLFESRLAHGHGTVKHFISRWSAGSAVAVETVGNWYWIVDEIEAGGGRPQLVNARLAKLMMGNVNKSDKLDAKGMNRLQRTGTLPTVWIPTSSVRDARELPRTRMMLSRQRTQLKNRVHATLGKYGYAVEGASDAFGKKGRKIVEELLLKLPPHTQQAVEIVLDELDHVTDNLKRIEGQMTELFSPCAQTNWLKSLPGVGDILAVVIWTEIGSIERFARAEQLASYCGLVAREDSSGARSALARYGAMSMCISSGPLSRRPIARCSTPSAAATVILAGFTSGSKHGAATARPKWRWPATSRRPVSGCSKKENPIANRCRPRNAKRARLMSPTRLVS